MACPKCGCKVCYQYDGGVEDHEPWPEDLERCAACGAIFYIDDHTPEDDDIELASPIHSLEGEQR